MKTMILISMVMTAIAACAITLDATDETQQGLCVPAGCDEFGCWGQQGDCGSTGGGGGGDPGGGGGGPYDCQPNPGSGCATAPQWSTASCETGAGGNLYCVGLCGGSLSYCALGYNTCVFAQAAGENGCR